MLINSERSQRNKCTQESINVHLNKQTNEQTKRSTESAGLQCVERLSFFLGHMRVKIP